MVREPVLTMIPELSAGLRRAPAGTFTIHEPATVPVLAWGQVSTGTAVFTTAILRAAMRFVEIHVATIHIATPLRGHGVTPIQISV